MLGTIYVGLSGMNAYSKGLDVISNNVANLNTVGFKAGIASFADAVTRNGTGATFGSGGTGTSGAGVSASEEKQNFAQGERRSTGNKLDAALEGIGFFVLERDGLRYYTRAGQFEINSRDGIIKERNSGASVLVTREGHPPGSLQIDEFRTFAPRVTSEVNLGGELARTGSSSADYTMPQFTVNDTTGASQTLKAHFIRNAADPLVWTVEVTNASNQVVGSGTLRFNADGTPAEGANSIEVTVTPENLPAFTFRLNLGAAGRYSGVTSRAGTTSNSVSMVRQDGLPLGTLQETNFDEHGNVRVTYSNGETITVARLVLARFDSGTDLNSVGDGLFVARQDRQPQLAAAMEFGLGRVEGGKLELSNVELTNQFTDLIMVQRGYQACSQMTSVANEMMQQLLAMQDRK
ncbi:MAG TPA: flagellar hook-basal body complex protein [Burkholderiaceae bacterium]|nr:flagellar hook-basal body complex protein [Burkholderiaceae bacterium]